MSLNGYDPCIHWSGQFAHRGMWVYNKESLSLSKYKEYVQRCDSVSLWPKQWIRLENSF